ncbi:translation initiation factor eif-2b alpha subunit [Coprinopsis cinerea okayama7|uniref:Translation initiation factor eIF2B subunit alpha n=1 Tax=Coprinopsis cinerea (strain Okayama-7 / 130 / ATCC MYA-4618 / FGSC 9003) TaxID=240176 RepID=A8NFI4_COPC7|nr:translation initiation factor eif-2b alpha subunit [Coprinopsis cinerea okayama7\|eukprot:XP_001833292.2 translation initiation factor eif-2b alpha subunit [Coprinopsis cinerea okayama7\
MPSKDPNQRSWTRRVVRSLMAHSFDIVKSFEDSLDQQIATPLAAVIALTELVRHSDVGTVFELVTALRDGAAALKAASPSPISTAAGCELFIAFVSLLPHASSNFADLKQELVRHGQIYAAEALTYRTKIAELAVGFIKDGSVILTHSYSRVVLQTLLLAHKSKRISVFVTEARPRGLGIKTAEALSAAGVPCTVILDSAVAYVMDKVDFVLVGSEAVVESGGLVNAVGSNQIAIIARAANKPFYALAESYKFHRLFPLSQYDLPSHNSKILSFPRPVRSGRSASVSRPTKEPTDGASSPPTTPPDPAAGTITQEQISQNNPTVDYTRPDLISLVFSDVGSLTPEGVSQYLVGMFAG